MARWSSSRLAFGAALRPVGLALFGLLALAARTAAAQGLGIDHARAYADCMTLARVAPQDAVEGALAWAAQGGGEAARHCAAVALIGLGRFAEAAGRLETLAAEMTPGQADLRPSVLAQSGQAWLMAGDTGRAHAVQSAALALDPDNVELLIDRSITLAAAANYWEALDDLNRALELTPERPELLILRASAYRYLDARALARDDIELALRLDPDNPDGLLERGILRRLAGDAAGARGDWLKVVAVAEGTPAAEAARANLEGLAVGAE